MISTLLALALAVCHPNHNNHINPNSIVKLSVSTNQCGGNFSVQKGHGPVTTVRASTETYQCQGSDGHLNSVGSNKVAVTDVGAQIFGPGTNYIQQSQSMVTGILPNAPFDISNATVVGDAAPSTDDDSIMDQITSDSIWGVLWQDVSVPAGVGPFTYSGTVRSPGGTGYASINGSCSHVDPATCACGTADGSPCTAMFHNNNSCTAIVLASAVPTRVWVTFGCSDPTFTINTGLYGGRAGTDSGVTAFWDKVQLEVANRPSPYHVTTTAAATWPGTVASIPSGLKASDTAWCRSATATLQGSWAVDAQLLGVGASGTPNSMGMFVGFDGLARCEVFDSAGNMNRIAGSHGFAPNSTHTVKCCSTPTAMTMYLDEVEVALPDVLLTGTGTMSTVPALTLGSDGATKFLNGFLSHVVECVGVSNWAKCL